MFDNLKKLEKAYEKTIKSNKNNDFALKLIKTLEAEITLEYSKKETILSLLKKDKEIRGLKKPKILSSLKIVNKDSKKLGAVEIEEYKYFDPSILKVLGHSYFFNSNLFIRVPEMKKYIINSLMNEQKRKEFLEHNEFFIRLNKYGSINFSFNKDILNEIDKEGLIDILDNYNTYLTHPDIGSANIEKELDLILDKYYNKRILFIEDHDNKILEFTI